MIGEAAKHRDELAAALPGTFEIVGLPQAAGTAPDFDSAIGADDVVVSMRLARKPAPMPGFGLLQLPGAGLDGIDLAAIAPSTWVCNVFEHELPIAEYVVLSMLHWVVGLDDMRGRFKADGWSQAYRARVPHGELAGRTVGLIGYGRIGKLIARKAAGLDMRVVALRRQAGTGDADLAETFAPDRLDQMLAQSDFIVVCCPLSEATRGMIGAAQFAVMKKDAVVINVARAEIVDEQALFEALESKRIAGAYLDVWYAYPSGPDDDVAPSRFPFDRLPNVVSTPHSSAWTTNLSGRRYSFIARNIQRYARGEPLENVVRAPAAAPARKSAAAGA